MIQYTSFALVLPICALTHGTFLREQDIHGNNATEIMDTSIVLHGNLDQGERAHL